VAIFFAAPRDGHGDWFKNIFEMQVLNILTKFICAIKPFGPVSGQWPSGLRCTFKRKIFLCEIGKANHDGRCNDF
jgi:hypothetical protein